MRLVLDSIIHKHLGDGGRRCPIEFARCLASRLRVQSIAVGHESVRSNARLASGLMARATWGCLIPRQARLQSLIWVSSPPLLSSVLARSHARPHACLHACLQARLHPPPPPTAFPRRCCGAAEGSTIHPCLRALAAARMRPALLAILGIVSKPPGPGPFPKPSKATPYQVPFGLAILASHGRFPAFRSLFSCPCQYSFNFLSYSTRIFQIYCF